MALFKGIRDRINRQAQRLSKGARNIGSNIKIGVLNLAKGVSSRIRTMARQTYFGIATMDDSISKTRRGIQDSIAETISSFDTRPVAVLDEEVKLKEDIELEEEEYKSP